MNYEDLRGKILELDLEVLEDENAREFFKRVSSDEDLSEAIENFPKELKDWVFETIESIPPPKDPEKFLADLSEKLKIRRIERRIAEIDEMIKKVSNDEERRLLLSMKLDLLRKIKRR